MSVKSLLVFQNSVNGSLFAFDSLYMNATHLSKCMQLLLTMTAIPTEQNLYLYRSQSRNGYLYSKSNVSNCEQHG